MTGMMILCLVNDGSIDLLVMDVVFIFKRKQVSTNDLWWKQMQIYLQCRYIFLNKNDLNTLRTGDADLRFYISTM